MEHLLGNLLDNFCKFQRGEGVAPAWLCLTHFFLSGARMSLKKRLTAGRAGRVFHRLNVLLGGFFNFWGACETFIFDGSLAGE